jgi:hypothetical protein
MFPWPACRQELEKWGPKTTRLARGPGSQRVETNPAGFARLWARETTALLRGAQALL